MNINLVSVTLMMGGTVGQPPSPNNIGSLYVGPVIYWWTVQGVPRLSPPTIRGYVDVGFIYIAHYLAH